MSTTVKKSKKGRLKRSKAYHIKGEIYRGLLPNGRISFNLKENSNCVELAKMGMSHQTIADSLDMTVNQVSYRLHKIGVSVMDYRRGESSESKVILNKFRVTYKD